MPASSPPGLPSFESPRHFQMPFTDRIRVALRTRWEFDFFLSNAFVRFFTRVALRFGFVALGDARFSERNEPVFGEFSDDDPFGVVAFDVCGDVAWVVVMV